MMPCATAAPEAAIVAVLGMGGRDIWPSSSPANLAVKRWHSPAARIRKNSPIKWEAHVYIDTEMANPGDELRKLEACE